MKMVVNPDFKHLNHFLKCLPDSFDTEGRTIYKSRNEIKTFEYDGLVLNVKSYRKPILINRIAYSSIRKSKARRAYENALKVREKGFETPMPIAYLEQKKGGLLNKSWFVSTQCSYPRMFREFADNSGMEGREDIPKALGVYVAALHEAGILHLDLSVGNILFEKDENGIRFSLIDINRMKFCQVDQETGCKNMERLRGSVDFFRILAYSYAEARGFDPESCLKKMLFYNRKSIEHFQHKRKVKQILHR